MPARGREAKRKLNSYPLYGTTFVLHRVSPLYIGPKTTLLSDEYLAEHAHRFRDILKGNVLRGVHIDSGSGNQERFTKVGGLKDCRWTVLVDEEAWADALKRQTIDEEGGGTQRAEAVAVKAGKSKAILIELEYETITYQANLLCNSDHHAAAPEAEDGFMHLPLLLTRMPGGLRMTLIEYLATTFDTRISQMKLPTEFLPKALERFFADLTVGQDRLQRSERIKSTVGDVQITLKCSESVTPLLKTIDFNIPKADLPLFLTAGQRLLDRSEVPAPVAGRKRKREVAEMGKRNQGPFLTALSSYMISHMALDLSHPGISIAKVACGAFVLGAEGKIKLFSPARDTLIDGIEEPRDHVPTSTELAMQNLIISMVEGAKSKRALREVTNNTHIGRQGEESVTIEQVDVDLPPPYELHDPSRIPTI